MGATNTTTYYNLSQFIGTDKPAWLQDYNGDMLKIDSGINAAKVAADNAANAASAAQGDATTALGGVSSLNTTVGTLSNTVGTAVGNINTINSLIGNGTPTTTDQTIIGAINELHADFINITPSMKLKASGSVTASSEPDGVLTNSQLGKEAADNLLAIATNAANTGCKLFITGLILTGVGAFSFPRIPITCDASLTSFYLDGDTTAVGSSAFDLFKYSLGANNAVSIRQIETLVADGSITAIDVGSAVATRKPIIYYEVFEPIA